MGDQKVGLLRVSTKGLSNLFKYFCLEGKNYVEPFKHGYTGESEPAEPADPRVVA